MATYDECDLICHEGSDTCKFCGKKGLSWRKTEYGWGLFDFDGKLHQCSIKCKFCGKKGLSWRETEYGWRLFDFDGKLHQC